MDKTYYLFRHAKAIGSDESYGVRIKTAEILPEGIPPIKQLARYLKLINDSLNYSSPYIRCRQTAKIITDITGKTFILDDRLKEHIPGEEPFVEVGKRVEDFLNSLENIEEKNIIICTHGIVIAAVKHLLSEGQFFQKDDLDYPKTGELWIMSGTNWHIEDFN